MKLLPGEEKLVSSNNDQVVLTSHRIEKNDKSFTTSIFLENISSIEVKFISSVWLLVVGIIIVLAGVYTAGQRSIGPINSQSGGMMVGLVIGGLFILFYFLSRKHAIRISSNGGAKIDFLSSGMSREKVSEFIHSVNLAKLKRVNQLHKVGVTSEPQKFTVAQPVS